MGSVGPSPSRTRHVLFAPWTHPARFSPSPRGMSGDTVPCFAEEISLPCTSWCGWVRWVGVFLSKGTWHRVFLSNLSNRTETYPGSREEKDPDRSRRRKDRDGDIDTWHEILRDRQRRCLERRCATQRLATGRVERRASASRDTRHESSMACFASATAQPLATRASAVNRTPATRHARPCGVRGSGARLSTWRATARKHNVVAMVRRMRRRARRVRGSVEAWC